jgi:hypothetical protein
MRTRHGAHEDPNQATTPDAAAAQSSRGQHGLRPVATGNQASAAADAFLVDSPGPGSPQVLGSFAFGSNYSRPSTADTTGRG